EATPARNLFRHSLSKGLACKKNCTGATVRIIRLGFELASKIGDARGPGFSIHDTEIGLHVT
nr:hypothetical protein [Candidatus Sigynarchaeota archaeon]